MHLLILLTASTSEGSTSSQSPMAVKYPPDFHIDSQSCSISLDAITNRIFEDLMKGKSKMAHNFDELGILDLESRDKVMRQASDSSSDSESGSRGLSIYLDIN